MAPVGGIVGELGGASRPMILTVAEVERFEEQYAPFGVFDVLGRFLDRKSAPQFRHCRDIVILGLIGGGMAEKAAHDLVTGLPLTKSLEVRAAAQGLLLSAFIPPAEESDSPPVTGDAVTDRKADTTSPKKSATS
ncbi:GTA-gp10 family protein [Loktanella atrilutea]|nr:GTA-gp10 family protein [Loktanella atrilutea]